MTHVTAQLYVYTNPASEEVLDEYNFWYNQVHIPQVVERIEGIVAARRIELAPAQLFPAEGLPAHRFAAIYDLATDDVDGTLGALVTALGDGTLDPSEAVDIAVTPPLMVVYTPH